MNKIGFIGGGKMASAILKSIISFGYASCENIFVSDKNENNLISLKEKHNINTSSNNSDIVKNCNIVIIAVKPYTVKEILTEIKPFLTENHLLMSIAAGVSIKTIENITGNVPVIRVMPNNPAMAGAGMSAICSGTCANASHETTALNIFKCAGRVIKTEEKNIDIITAISGSGPAFYYYIINEIAKAGEKLGLDYKTCLELSAQTALGSAKMILEGETTPEQLIINVTTPGGCTAEGNNVLINNNVSDILYETIEKTAKKASQLG